MNQYTEGARIAYFSMEIALNPAIPTYSGGLGVLAGDTLRSAADLGVPMVAVTLLHRKGYFRQHLDANGSQTESPWEWDPADFCDQMPAEITVTLEDRSVVVRTWRYLVTGNRGYIIPVFLLDTGSEQNSPYDRSLTDTLYGGDTFYRLCQEVILGIGGVRMLEALGYSHLEKYHMNEGHSALIALELIEKLLGSRRLAEAGQEDIDALRIRCVFTTHTPVPAGHDRFPRDFVYRVLGAERTQALERGRCFDENYLNMTYLALRASSYINGVAMLHGEVSKSMFPNYPVSAITNGVHAVTWAAEPMAEVFDRFIPEWRKDNEYLRYALGMPVEEIWEAHQKAKKHTLQRIREATRESLDPEVFTIGFARRAASYKRADLLFWSTERLEWIANRIGRFQIVYAGKAHPLDERGKEMIRRIHSAAREVSPDIKVVYVPNYNWEWGQLLTSGVDLWLNTPKRPQEASGTSGMKAALNGVPSLSIMDGWWVEGRLEGVTGWAIGRGNGEHHDPSLEAGSLYDKLESAILPLYYGNRRAYSKVMRNAIAINGSFFNTQRMVSQYVRHAYFPLTDFERMLREHASPETVTR